MWPEEYQSVVLVLSASAAFLEIPMRRNGAVPAPRGLFLKTIVLFSACSCDLLRQKCSVAVNIDDW